MMNGKGPCPGEQVLDAILADLDESRMRTQIDEPIEAVFRAFAEGMDYSAEPRTAHEVFSQFVQCVYRAGLRAPWKVTDPDATTLLLLESHYHGLQSEGYSAAIQDATGPAPGGMTFALTQLADIIRTQERDQYVDAVFTRRIDPFNWRLRCEIVEVLLERCRPWLPPHLLDCAVWQLVDEIPAMVVGLLSSCPVLGGVAKPA
jgi:hypothetical protein